MSNLQCTECKRPTRLVHDHAAGDVLCTECGLVLEAHSVDETSEWRTFSNESSGADPARVGGPLNPLLADGGLATMISKTGGSADLPGRRGWASQATDPNRELNTAFSAIGDMAERLSLVQTIRERANEIFARVHSKRTVRGRGNEAMYAACLFIACRQADNPRSYKEIASAGSRLSKKEVGKASKIIISLLEADLGMVEMGTANAADFMRRFCSRLTVEPRAVQAAIEVVQNADKVDMRSSRTPISKAAAAIYMVSQMCDRPLHARDVAEATGVAEGTIRNTYKDMLPFAAELLPSWFAKPEDIRRLPPS